MNHTYFGMAIPTKLSKTQIDRLGDRLRTGDISEADLRLLDSYRRSFTDAYEAQDKLPDDVKEQIINVKEIRKAARKDIVEALFQILDRIDQTIPNAK